MSFVNKNDSHNKAYEALLKKPPPAFQPENTVIILIKVDDFESDFGFYNKGLVSEIFALTLLRKITSSDVVVMYTLYLSNELMTPALILLSSWIIFKVFEGHEK